MAANSEKINKEITTLIDHTSETVKNALLLVGEIGEEISNIKTGDVMSAISEAPALAEEVRVFIKHGDAVVEDILNVKNEAENIIKETLVKNSDKIKGIEDNALKLKNSIVGIFNEKDGNSWYKDVINSFENIEKLAIDTVGLVEKVIKDMEVDKVVENMKNIFTSASENDKQQEKADPKDIMNDLQHADTKHAEEQSNILNKEKSSTISH